MYVSEYTDAQKQEFVAGFESITGPMADYDTPYPWACPWDWDDFECNEASPYEEGRAFALEMRDEIKALQGEEAAV